MKSLKYLALCFAGLILSSGACAHEITTPPWSIQKDRPLTIEEQQECMALFENILSIQETRNQKSNEMARLTIMRGKKEISKKKYRAFYETWLANENRLAGDVNKLYLVATDKGCFNKIEGSEG